MMLLASASGILRETGRWEVSSWGIRIARRARTQISHPFRYNANGDIQVAGNESSISWSLHNVYTVVRYTVSSRMHAGNGSS